MHEIDKNATLREVSSKARNAHVDRANALHSIA